MWKRLVLWVVFVCMFLVGLVDWILWLSLLGRLSIRFLATKESSSLLGWFCLLGSSGVLPLAFLAFSFVLSAFTQAFLALFCLTGSGDGDCCASRLLACYCGGLLALLAFFRWACLASSSE